MSVHLAVPEKDTRWLVDKRFVVYIGLGACKSEGAKIYNLAKVQSLDLPLAEDHSIAWSDPMTLTAAFDKSAVKTRECAFIKAASMYGAGGISAPIPIVER